MSIFESFLYNIILLIISFHLCISVKWKLNYSVYYRLYKTLCSTACMFLYSHTAVIKDFDNNVT